MSLCQWCGQETAYGSHTVCPRSVHVTLPAMTPAEPAQPARLTDDPNTCVVCTFPIVGSKIGMGDGTGQKYAHEECYWRQAFEVSDYNLQEMRAAWREQRDKLADLESQLAAAREHGERLRLAWMRSDEHKAALEHQLAIQQDQQADLRKRLGQERASMTFSHLAPPGQAPVVIRGPSCGHWKSTPVEADECGVCARSDATTEHRALIADLIGSVSYDHPALDWVEVQIDRADYERAKEMSK